MTTVLKQAEDKIMGVVVIILLAISACHMAAWLYLIWIGVKTMIDGNNGYSSHGGGSIIGSNESWGGGGE